MKSRQENNFNKLINSIGGGVQLTNQEIRSLMWLAIWEEQTVSNICSVIEKVSQSRVNLTGK